MSLLLLFGGGAPSPAPTLSAFAYNSASWDTSNPSGTVYTVASSFTWVAGDVVVVMVGTDDNSVAKNHAFALDNETNLTFTQVSAATAQGSNSYAKAWTAVATGAGSGTISGTFTTSTGNGRVLLQAWHWTNTAGVGNTAGAEVLGTTPTKALTPSANSAVCVALYDWNAAAAGMTGETNTGTFTERIDQRSSVNAYTIWSGEWIGVAAGADSWGVTDGTGRAFSLAAVVEVLGPSAGGTTVTAQVATLTLSGVPGAPSGGPVSRTAQVANLTLTGVAGTTSGGPVTVTAQPATLTLTGVPGSPSLGGGSPQTVNAQVATLTLTGIPGSPSGGSVSRNAQVATLTLAGVQTAPIPGPVARAAQVATLTLSGIPGAPTGGPVTRTAQVATLTLVGVPGSPSTPSDQIVTAQVAVLTLVGVPGVVIVMELPPPGITFLSAGSDVSPRHTRRPTEGTWLSRRR